MNEMDKLESMLKEAWIPYEKRIRTICPSLTIEQIIYGKSGVNEWLLDAIMFHHHDEYSMLETWGPLGSDKDGEPLFEQKAIDVADKIFAHFFREGEL